MSSFSDLPNEITTTILAIAISQHPNPGHILAVNRRFKDIGQFVIYTSLNFKSASQLVRFALKGRFRHHNRGLHRGKHHHHPHKSNVPEGVSGEPTVVVSAAFPAGSSPVGHGETSDSVAQKLLPHFPRSVTVRIPGGQRMEIVFEGIKHVFEFCAVAVGTGVLALDSLEFCLNSYTNDPTPWRIGEALSLVNPRKFVWTGPDPPHHFSIAIVHHATYHLFQAIKSWSNLQTLTLTNISFPPRNTFVPVTSSSSGIVFCTLANGDETFSPLETLPNLRSVYIGQATQVPIRSIAKLVLSRQKPKLSAAYDGKGKDFRCPDMEEGKGGLREIRLVDAYKNSIWQERIRRKHLETVAMEVASSDTPLDPWYYAPTGEIDSEAVLGRIREIVSCEALTERLMGGDRAEGMTTLI